MLPVEESLDELARLADTAGLDVVGRTSQRLDQINNATFIGPGKVEEVKILVEELDANAAEVYNVTPRGIDTIVDLYRREVEFCARLGTSRPEEGAEHIVAYNIENITHRHFIHGDLVGLGIFVIARLQRNKPAWAEDLMRRLGLRFACPDASLAEIRTCLETLKTFKDEAGLFYSILDEAAVTSDFLDTTMRELEKIRSGTG